MSAVLYQVVIPTNAYAEEAIEVLRGDDVTLVDEGSLEVPDL